MAGGGGLMIYVRSDIHFVKVKHLKGITPEEWVAFRTETIILKVKLGRSRIAVVGIYRHPPKPKHQLTREFSSIFEEVSTLTETVFYAGDFIVALLDPNKDSRNLLDLPWKSLVLIAWSIKLPERRKHQRHFSILF